MHYVKQFNINGVDTKQVACIELQGAPNAATEGAVGVLGIDMLSPTHEVYKCVAVNGSVYTWELLSAGMSIMSAIITGEGALEQSFPYDKLRIPRGYIVKLNDLILDSEGYLYQIISIGNDSCVASYCGTHIGGIASGDKDYTLEIKNGRLCLVTESGKVLSAVNYITSDNVTLYQNPSTGVASVLGVKTISGSVLYFFVGTHEEYEALTDEQKENLFAIISDDNTKEMLLAEIDEVRNNLADLKEDLADGDFKVALSDNSDNADKINNLEIKRDENDVLKIGDIIIPQKKILSNSPITITNGETTKIYDESRSLIGKTLEVDVDGKFYKFNRRSDSAQDIKFTEVKYAIYDSVDEYVKVSYEKITFTITDSVPTQISVQFQIYSGDKEAVSGVEQKTIRAIYEIIE